ncbi:MAG: hypothetical protein ISS71_09740 [Phycisphaerae bacterium]|nr:hypothetical protein [Phycisphaerae bacterium]
MMMLWRLLAIVIVVLASAAIGGCKKQSEPVEPAEVKVTEENLDTELDKMEKEIEADIAAQE